MLTPKLELLIKRRVITNYGMKEIKITVDSLINGHAN